MFASKIALFFHFLSIWKKKFDFRKKKFEKISKIFLSVKKKNFSSKKKKKFLGSECSKTSGKQFWSTGKNEGRGGSVNPSLGQNQAL